MPNGGSVWSDAPKKRRTKKPESGICRPRNSFIIYREHVRPSIEAKNPSIEFKELCKYTIPCDTHLPTRNQYIYLYHATRSIIISLRVLRVSPLCFVSPYLDSPPSSSFIYQLYPKDRKAIANLIVLSLSSL